MPRRITVTVSDELHDRLSRYADARAVSLSTAGAVLIESAFEADRLGRQLDALHALVDRALYAEAANYAYLQSVGMHLLHDVPDIKAELARIRDEAYQRQLSAAKEATDV